MSDEDNKRPLSEKQLEQRRAAGSRPKTVSDAMLLANKENAQKSTGPITEDGKIAVSRNAWKHGMYAEINTRWRDIGMGLNFKPCKSTCELYPCELVNSGETKPGADCLDKTVYLHAFNALMDALSSENAEATHGLLASQVAGAVEVLHMLKEYLSKNSIVVKRPIFDKIGRKIGEVDVINPALGYYMDMLGKLGLNLPELMATPKSVKSAKTDEDAVGAVHELLGRVGRAANIGNGPARHQTYDVTPENKKTDKEGD